MSARDDDFWTQDRHYGEAIPMSLNRMRESAHGVIARTWISSASEIAMARAVLHLLDLLDEERSRSAP